ncbi:MAG: hypothetical protein AVDCRST_MAG77-2368 [uncultured Chloroflexi bacterium]|uniref:Probable 2-phosphosulfolactate phosphatase n=1 Tax=uncultured Chloroflexota bacterium TaxID=166587 RepID=A0A6J4IMW2_9CHLR|nr:MAG: hypothetical protein AVDCRST_MAG77-2368 [uncultured Chloroflexota bacterium]
MISQALRDSPNAELDDPAEAARRLYQSFGNPVEAVQAAGNARRLRELGLGDDVLFCAQLDVTTVVPEVARASQAPPWPLHVTRA